MSKANPFLVYNASAGSGKTFTLVKEYLKILFASSYKDQFRSILALTFTNKAVAEMKTRILDTLKEFSDKSIMEKPNSIFLAICEELPIEANSLHQKSKTILNTIMHNYAAFDISTIDGFNYRLIRTFAHDLKLPLNFEVELDVNNLLNEAVDSLIAKAGNDKALTKVLIDFAIEKADDDKSWDVARDFNAIAHLLTKENDLKFVNTLKGKSLEDFKKLKLELKAKIDKTEKKIIDLAQELLILFEESGLQFDDFSGSYLPKHFEKLSKKNFVVNFDAKWQEELESKTLYPKRVTQNIASVIEQIQPQIASAFAETKSAIYHIKFLKNFYKNITPLSVLNAINNELNTIKTEQNKMLVSEFNSIISNEIKNQPTPFIYERMGEKFRHYFIDEFQDTSEMQWENLIPLIDNTLSGQNLKGEQGTAMLVGDAKQAIYRWRGGKAEQFIGLFNDDNPFQLDKNLKNLPANYRSLEHIVNFNNNFFKFLSTASFSNIAYSKLYECASQNSILKEKGYVNLSFLDFEKNDDKDTVYTEHILETINSCIENGYALKDICVLIRKKKEGIAIAECLSNKGIKITSSETMLINNSPEVNLINNILNILVNPEDKESKLAILDYLANKYNVENKHLYFKSHIALDQTPFFKSFETFNIQLDNKILLQQPLFDMVEAIVRAFNLVETSNAYVQFYLDTVLDYSQKYTTDLSGFIEYFNNKKDSLSIVSPQNQDAVQIMTIHKSKGLEFPIVIFPYAELDIYKEIEPKEWFVLNPNDYNGFSHTLLNYNKDFEFFGEEGQRIYEKHQAELELDNINLLYVALTRPIEQLYIIGKKDFNAKKEVNTKTYSGLLINFLMQIGEWNDAQLTYSFGNPKREIHPEIIKNNTIEQTEFISTSKKEHNIKILANSGYLWDTNQENAIEKGNLIHDLMAHIKTTSDIDFVIEDFISEGTINKIQAKELKETLLQIVNHPELKSYFNEVNTIFNERDIITKNGKILRPDRLVINNTNEVTIIDYKTGLHNPKYQHQLQDYQDVLEEMDYKVTNKILIYINDSIKIQSY